MLSQTNSDTAAVWLRSDDVILYSGLEGGRRISGLEAGLVPCHRTLPIIFTKDRSLKAAKMSLLREHFVSGEGIRREIISAEIQNFLGPDATVRPGKRLVKGEEVGFLGKVYRYLCR